MNIRVTPDKRPLLRRLTCVCEEVSPDLEEVSLELELAGVLQLAFDNFDVDVKQLELYNATLNWKQLFSIIFVVLHISHITYYVHSLEAANQE